MVMMSYFQRLHKRKITKLSYLLCNLHGKRLLEEGVLFSNKLGRWPSPDVFLLEFDAGRSFHIPTGQGRTGG